MSDEVDKHGRLSWHVSVAARLYTFATFDQWDRIDWHSAISMALINRSSDQLLSADRQCSTNVDVSTTTTTAAAASAYSDRLLAWRLALESDNARLTEQLARERQAVHDEEIVRNIATRMLDEERHRTEQLEQTIADQEAQLIRERAYREQLLIDDAEREIELSRLRERLDSLNATGMDNGRCRLPMSPKGFDGDRVLKQLRRGRQALIECRRELHSSISEHRATQMEFAVETGELLDHLIDKHLPPSTRRRRTKVDRLSSNFTGRSSV
jgi:hypothetical protein